MRRISIQRTSKVGLSWAQVRYPAISISFLSSRACRGIHYDNVFTVDPRFRGDDKNDSETGFTLIEILIGLTIVSLMVMLVIPSVNRISQADLRSSVRQLAVTSRALYNEAVLRKKLFRLVLDLDENKYWPEMSAANSLVYLRDEKLKEEEDKNFSTFQSGFSKYEDQLLKEKTLPTGVVFQDVMNGVLYAQPVSGGHAYIFFYPRGEVDPTLIHISHDRPGGVSYTVEFLPVSGNTRFYMGYTGFKGVEMQRPEVKR